MHQKLVPGPFLFVVNNRKQSLYAVIPSEWDILKEDYQKALKKLTLCIFSNPVPFNGQDYEKQKRPETGDQSLFRLRNKLRKISLLVMYYLAKLDDVI